MDRFEFYARLPRNEPGGVAFTNAYLTAVPIKANDRVCDLECASGDRAVWIARSRGCRVVAVDGDARYLPNVRRRAVEGGASQLVLPVCADPRNPPLVDGAFRVVLAEGAALGLGLKAALTLWRRIIMPEGHLCVTYPGVVNKDAPNEVRAPLERRMADPLGTLADYHGLVRSTGFELVHQVPLHADLWEQFYAESQRHAWALVASGAAREDDPTIKTVLAEAQWFRTVGRSRVFLQAMVLRRVR
ncbi:MAG: SAM-dependent methyltransferase [Bradymonadia bacterium]